MTTRKAWLLGAAFLGLGVLTLPQPAAARHWHGGPHVGVGFYVGPPAYWGPRWYPPPVAYYVPPPIYYAPPPVIYTPAPGTTWPGGQPYIPGYVPITPASPPPAVTPPIAAPARPTR
ncbi:hypothetical protein JYK14_21930 [Siccirubricoccus sp. KC 17139]|uniref:Sulfur globule protein CV3 n=1 Tax=Siccirubricoccus soli TaxID=2899147 RepID=A0ABT1DA26_9PROT|nr:hypothetical protein [Siccirubricoccus soli]MCO6418797.1 hypothetical protein [Siccirubricoccus soli]MCP2684932.1 hypothetical protein [Siccirubricoccus soli]